MSNYCINRLTIEGPEETLSKIRNLVNGEKTVFDFEKIVPMPDYIYRGNVGPKEIEIYGENTWYDWCVDNWGTKWNSVEAFLDDDFFEVCLEYWFDTAWDPPHPVIKALAEMFPDAKIYFAFEDCSFRFIGKQIFENGQMTYNAYGDYRADWTSCDADDDELDRSIYKYESPTVFL